MNRKDTIVQAQTARATVSTYAATVSIRSYFSTHHLAAAALFARESARLEADYTIHHSGEPPTAPAVFGLFSAHRSNVIGSILRAVGFLEAAINELYVDAAELHLGNIGSLNTSTIQSLGAAWIGTWWQKGIDRESVLKKYQIALELSGQALLDRGHPPYQDVDRVIALRNELTHYKPWSLVAQEAPQHPLDGLRGKFAESAFFATTGNSFYPDKCLGHGCANWAVKSSISFANDFFSRLGVTPNYQAHANTLRYDAG